MFFGKKQKAERAGIHIGTLFVFRGRCGIPQPPINIILLQLLITIHGTVAKLLLYTNELVVLGHAVGTAHATRLDLARVGGHCDVGNGGVLCLARTV